MFFFQFLDGPMARRVFEDIPFLHQVTDFPLDLLHSMWNLNIALSSNLPLSPVKVQQYCKDFKDNYRRQIPWYPLPPSICQVVDHFHQVIQVFPATIRSGMTSEQPQEHINKFIVEFQTKHSRQIGYVERNTDTMNRLLEQSDPIVMQSYERPSKTGEIRSYPEEVLNLCYTSDEIQRQMAA